MIDIEITEMGEHPPVTFEQICCIPINNNMEISQDVISPYMKMHLKEDYLCTGIVVDKNIMNDEPDYNQNEAYDYAKEIGLDIKFGL